MFEFHRDKKRYFDIQRRVTEEDIIPFLVQNNIKTDGQYVLEIGCGEAGVLDAFVANNTCVGIELSAGRVKLAEEFHKENIAQGKIRFITKNIHDIDIARDLSGKKFDIIILKDVIEHIFEQKKFMRQLHQFLQPDGIVFFGFPPWQMPFGGHQQVCRNKFLGKLPYFHLLPRFLYKWMLTIASEKERTIQELLELRTTGLSIGQFKKLALETDYAIRDTKYYLFNPIYRYKFGLKTRIHGKLIPNIPYVRNFVTTGVYILLEKNNHEKHI